MGEGESFLSGVNPLTDNLALFLLQVVIIIAVSRAIAVPLRYLRQPAVISEVIGGIVLGPSVLSRSQSFRDTVFPTASLPPRLKLIADFGLILFLFLVGLELDPRTLAKQFHRSAAISLAGIALPFGVGVAVSRLIYDLFADHHVSFTSFFVFCGVAMSITAFPVLARILTERKLLRTTVGQVTMAAAATDDAMAWCLLVLVVALIHNPSNSIFAFYVFLAVVAWALFLWFAIRPVLLYLVKRTPSGDAVSQTAVLATFTGVCISAWCVLRAACICDRVSMLTRHDSSCIDSARLAPSHASLACSALRRYTQAVGVHAIFGGFLLGIITPHENGFAIKITEKVEDLISILFLPLYFAYSGLNFSIDSVSDGTAWGMVLLVIVVACGGKIVGCTLASRVSGLDWRESFTVGFLMNTKGLVELIVLNLGLQAGVINTKIFTIFVIMALVTTFMTVPIVSTIYPMSMYQHQTTVAAEIGDHERDHGADTGKAHSVSAKGGLKILVCLPGMQTVPAMMHFTQLFGSASSGLSVFALRIVELSSRMSKVMMASESAATLRSDPVVNVFRTFSQLNRIAVRTLLTVADAGDFADNIIDTADAGAVDLVLIPVDTTGDAHLRGNMAAAAHAVFERAPCTVALFVDRGFGVSSAEDLGSRSFDDSREADKTAFAFPGSNQRIFFPFVGGQDDCEAAIIIQRIGAHPGLSVVVLAITVAAESSAGSQDGGRATLTDKTAGAARSSHDEAVLAELAAVPGVEIQRIVLEDPTETVLARADEFGPKDLIVVGKSLYDTHPAGSTAQNSDGTPASPLRFWLDNTSTSSLLVVQRSQAVSIVVSGEIA
ncbi:K(+)/H(+) antiporter [Polyrhizophydium stewartii]|uniref:K(+)/H(+) antiporter n=1 Tax=Polyrhizophydium stewartii TaxID=2732419 RepID=A0ABR4NLD5_9FUNG